VSSALSAAIRGFSVVVADAPRHGDECTNEVLQRSTLIVLIVPREVRAMAAAQRRVESLQLLGSALAVVTRAVTPAGPDPLDVAETLGLPHLGDIRTDGRLATATERGDPFPERGHLVRIADAVLAAA
jgi:Flp pilus assembly CpaE family ATPase